ncbi:MBL fold metallo-hydrolase [Kribbella sp. NPDC051620]|uniref:MBL fold metallo-hydrolase n=1 Tax=Kribbella sp. NPDC051620 TaxID=3364120 RepID=UPI0037B0A13C
MGTLSYEVFISDPIPQNVAELVPNGDRRMFSPLSTTLIFGERDAVLVDPPLTVEQTERVGDWVEASGKNLRYVYATHGHGDHWFGTAPLLERFPGAAAYASPGTIAMMRRHGSPEFRAALWDKLFPGQIPASPILATTPPDNRFELEGQELISVEVGHSDTDDTTVLHVPSIGLVVAGDVVYNGVHQYLSESADGGIDAWLAALKTVEALQPASVVSGHKKRANPDSPETIAQTRQYLLDAKRLLDQPISALDFFHAMLELHPNRLNPGALWGGAVARLG